MWYTSSELNAQDASTHTRTCGRWLSFVSVSMLLLVVLLSACGGSTTGSQPNITLKLITWNNPATVKALTKLDNAFHQKYPNITVQPTIVSSDTYDSQLAPTRLQANDVDILSTEGGSLQRLNRGHPVPQNQPGNNG
ncbi:hypothetical protein [Dictyobacter kobayashii]|uniref:Extracellular solute-binding protein n=1 Tax=Dictyobacter kobayashii TaxID=2014872 RepID=A0A402ADF2_9CHLR|nr:hypothetical protein [Dictyobacter kobayashii]GCE17125.1 hypothetical protein KDK_09250 [Dictyobacter kobayashii]